MDREGQEKELEFLRSYLQKEIEGKSAQLGDRPKRKKSYLKCHYVQNRRPEREEGVLLRGTRVRGK